MQFSSPGPNVWANLLVNCSHSNYTGARLKPIVLAMSLCRADMQRAWTADENRMFLEMSEQKKAPLGQSLVDEETEAQMLEMNHLGKGQWSECYLPKSSVSGMWSLGLF